MAKNLKRIAGAPDRKIDRLLAETVTTVNWVNGEGVNGFMRSKIKVNDTIIKAVLCFTILSFLIGCATTNKLTPAQLASADYGMYPENYEQLVRDHFQHILFDPYSAQYEFEAPITGYTRKALILGGGPDKYGYIVTVYINAKNRFGGYVGSRKYQFLIKNGRIIQNIFLPEQLFYP